ncbi:MAG TPA: hypothetical protein VFH88_05625 [Candidatus Krumholzibacteria bacterium]|nr:hypothetical protein [Candidatus Krumholzibacteria bacterium]
MKTLPRVLLLICGLAVVSALAPVSRAEELPLEKTSSGSTLLTYAGQTFKVNSSAAVRIRFETVSATAIKISLVSDNGSTGGRVTIYWSNFDKYIYIGQIPLLDPWTSTLNTEGGFIDR